MNEWLKKEGDELFLDYLKKSHEFFKFLSESEDNIEFCIKCKQDTKKVLCVHCYTHSAYTILESINWVKAEKFKIIFDFGSSGPNSKDDYEVIQMKTFDSSISEQESILKLCEDCGSPSYFAQEVRGETVCERCS